MIQELREYAENLLKAGSIKGFLGLQSEGVQIRPFLFTQPEQLAQLTLGEGTLEHPVRYPLVKILNRIARRFPADSFGIMVRGCEERAIIKLCRASQMDRNRLFLAGFPCSEELACRHGCLKPYPDHLVAGSAPPVAASEAVITPTERNFIRDIEFIRDFCDRCIKCFGCRNICPVCYCSECTLEEKLFLPRGELPPANPNFLLTRAIHMVDYCVYCGLCEEACPADIPLTTLYKMVANLIDDQQEYILKSLKVTGDAAFKSAAV